MIAIYPHPLSEPLNQLAALMILLGGALYAYAFYHLHQHGALSSFLGLAARQVGLPAGGRSGQLYFGDLAVGN